MNLKLFKRSSVLTNTMFFALLSPLFLHIVNSLSIGVSALDGERLKAFLSDQVFLLSFAAVVVVSLFKAWRIAGHLFLIYTFVVFAQAFWPFLEEFDKLLLFFDFFYLIIGFYLFVLWRLEINEAIYLPGFNKRSLGAKSEYDLSARVYSLRTGEEVEGHLTNWDEKSLFFVPNSQNPRLRGKVRLKLEFSNRVFQAQGTVATGYGGGFGIRLDESRKVAGAKSSPGKLGWREYYDIINNRGYKPRFV